jgi:phosphoribosylformylglycinamidine synthase
VRYRAEVFVTLKPVVNDPAGLTIKGGLHALGFESVTEVRAGKYLLLTLDEADAAQARARVDDMARQLLANAVIEDYRIDLEVESPSPIPSPSGGGQGGGLPA